MTSGTILPSIGPPPPEFRRPIVPENLRPKLASETAEQPSRQNPSSQPQAQQRPSSTSAPSSDSLLRLAGQLQQQENERQPAATENEETPSSQPPPSANLGGASAVALQVQESEPATARVNEQKLQGELSDEEKAIVQRLQERDREVRAHENAHASVGRGYTGTPSYEFARGPDGVQYAVGGHVDIDAGPVPNDPEATITKMEVVRSAALAPARPSGQDKAVASAAQATAREAEAQLRAQQKEEQEASQAKADEGPVNIAAAVTDPANADSASTISAGQSGAPTFSGGLTGSPIAAIGALPTISIDLLV